MMAEMNRQDVGSPNSKDGDHMVKRPLFPHRVLTGIAAAGLLAGGCQTKPSQTNHGSSSDSVLAMVPEESEPLLSGPSQADAARLGPAGPAVVTSRVQKYMQQLGPLIDKQSKLPATQPAGEPSAVQWIKPGTLIAPAARRDIPAQVVPLAHPVVDAQPSSANQQLAINTTTPAVAPSGLTTNPDVTMRINPEDLNRSVTTKPAVLAPDLESKFAAHIQDHPRDLWAHLDFQLLHFLRDEQVPQLDALTTLPLEDRELIAAVMDGLTNFRNALRTDNNMLLSRKIKPLLELTERLRSQAELNIPALALCTRVDGFGSYVDINPTRFIAGKEHQAIIYCEVENFASIPSTEKKLFEQDKKTWDTRLSQEAVLYTESGMPVWVDKAGVVVDHARNHRRDFFIVKKITLPAALTIGRYLLKVTVEDQQAKRVAEQTMQIEIVAQMDVDGPLAGNKQ